MKKYVRIWNVIKAASDIYRSDRRTTMISKLIAYRMALDQ